MDGSVWGAIQYYEMSYPDIYFMAGRLNEGYIVPKSYRGKLLSPKALSFGEENGGLPFFAVGVTMGVVEYELLRNRLPWNCNPK